MQTAKQYSIILLVYLCALCATGNGRGLGRSVPPPPPPFAEPVELKISTDRIVLLEESGTDGLVTQKPIQISVGSVLPHWVLSCSASEFKGPDDAKIAPSQICIVLLNSTGIPLKSGAESFLNLDGMIPIAEGGPTDRSMIQAADFQLMAPINVDVLPGKYGGTILIAAHTDILQKPVRVWPVDAELVVPDVVRIIVDSEPMDFGNQQTGVHLSLTTPKVEIRTNRHDLRITATMQSLVNVTEREGEIPGSQTALAWGHNPNQALKNVKQTSIGESTFTWDCPPGSHILYLAGQVNVTSAVAPGKYQGKIMITLGVR